jgi:alpha-glucosidase (family GH31 glycosyl hydrolase)
MLGLLDGVAATHSVLTRRSDPLYFVDRTCELLKSVEARKLSLDNLAQVKNVALLTQQSTETLAQIKAMEDDITLVEQHHTACASENAFNLTLSLLTRAKQLLTPWVPHDQENEKAKTFLLDAMDDYINAYEEETTLEPVLDSVHKHSGLKIVINELSYTQFTISGGVLKVEHMKLMQQQLASGTILILLDDEPQEFNAVKDAKLDNLYSCQVLRSAGMKMVDQLCKDMQICANKASYTDLRERRNAEASTKDAANNIAKDTTKPQVSAAPCPQNTI